MAPEAVLGEQADITDAGRVVRSLLTESVRKIDTGRPVAGQTVCQLETQLSLTLITFFTRMNLRGHLNPALIKDVRPDAENRIVCLHGTGNEPGQEHGTQYPSVESNSLFTHTTHDCNPSYNVVTTWRALQVQQLIQKNT